MPFFSPSCAHKTKEFFCNYTRSTSAAVAAAAAAAAAVATAAALLVHNHYLFPANFRKVSECK